MSLAAPRFWIGTDIGLIRHKNEDAFLWLGPEQTDNNGYLWVLADGMGSSEAGDVASAMLITAFEEGYPEAIDETRNPYAAIERCAQEANRRILHTGETYPSVRGLGTTFVALAVYNNKAYVAHVGDSRCYTLKQGQLLGLTTDHVNPTATARATIDRTEARRNSETPLLSRSVGRPRLEVDFGDAQPLDVAGRVFVLATDGVWSVLNPEHLRTAMERLDARDAVEGLVELARRAWSDDNLSAAVVRFAMPDPRSTMDRDAFVNWASGAITGSDGDRTMVLRAVGALSDERPPHTNITSVPTIAVQAAAAAPTGHGAVSTTVFSADRIRALVEQATTNRPASGPSPHGSPAGGATVAFSVDEIRAAAAGAPVSSARPSRPPLPTDQLGQVGVPESGTLAFSVGELEQLEAKLRANSAAGTQSFSRQEMATLAQLQRAAAPAQGNSSTLFFSAQQMQQMVAQAAPPRPPVAFTQPPMPAPDLPATPVATAQMAPQQAAPAPTPWASAPVQPSSPWAPAPTPSPGGAPPAGPSLSREPTALLTADQIRRALEGPPREATSTLTHEELDSLMGERPPQARRGMAGVVVGLVVTCALLGGAAYYRFGRAPAPTPGADQGASAGAATDPAPVSDGVAEPVAEPEPEVPLPPVPPATPRAPDGAHEADQMPYYRVSLGQADGRERSLRVDAHEVLAVQMSALRGRSSDMELVYSTQSAALFEYIGCSGVYTDARDALARVPVCATPEVAEAYCNAVGRRLPTPEEWTAVATHSGGLLEMGGELVRFRTDGAPAEVSTSFTGIVGFGSGLAEVLRASPEQVAAGDLPVLRPAGAGEGALAPGVMLEAGLLGRLRSRNLTPDTTPLLGFRCVADDTSGRRPSGRPAASRPPREAIDRTPRPPVLVEDTTTAPAEPERGERIELMDPVYLPSTIEEYEAQVRDQQN